MKNKTRIYIFLIGFTFSYFFVNSIRIYTYSFEYTEQKSDVAIVLGAGTNNGKLSPVFTERINHGIYLFEKGLIDKLIITGGTGQRQKQSDSHVGKTYAIKKGVPEKKIIIEEKSKFTIENIIQSKQIMDSLGLKTALIVSDPMHMKRAIKITETSGINGNPSPTKTSMYRSIYSKTKFLLYEAFYFTLREVKGLF